MAEEQKFASEIIELPSKGKLYPEGHPCSDGKIEVKYMTAKEEDILTSANLVKKGIVIDRLLDSLILTPNVRGDDLLIGDKNALMVAARILAYGPEYACELTDPDTGEKQDYTFNLADCPFKHIEDGVTENLFDFTLPISKKKIKFSLLTGKDERLITEDLKASKKAGTGISPELTTRFRYIIKEVEGDNSPAVINNIAQNILARDSMALREEITRVQPDIQLKQDIELGGETVEVDIPMTVTFFWPNTKK
tara:strand:+ start:269 stop:1021 length:753 start_codon:yes stop_codon:yes gene_type:complete